MGRKREFNYEAALEKATHLFWQKGYSNTSLRDLLKVMKIGESSFYHLAQNKQNFYLECLKHYNDTVTKRRWQALTSQPTVEQGLRAFFKSILDDLESPKTPNVCLMAGSLASDVLDVPNLNDYVVNEMNFLEQEIVKLFDRGKKNGELSKEFDSVTSAQIVITYLQGFFRVARVLKKRKQLESQIDSLLNGLQIKKA